MNLDEFSNLANSRSPKDDVELIVKNKLAEIHAYLTRLADESHKKYPNTLDTLAVDSNAVGKNIGITLAKKRLSYDYDNKIISVHFNGKVLEEYSFNGSEMVSSKTGMPLTTQSVDEHLNYFK